MHWLASVLVAGCSYTAMVGARGVGSTHDRSAEVAAGVGAGIASPEHALYGRVDASVGPAQDGSYESHVSSAAEWVTVGDRFGWQVSLRDGVAVGAYQTDHVIFELLGGPRWNLTRQHDRIWSLELDAGIGYAIGLADHPDGLLYSLSIATRFDTLDLTKPPM